MYQFKIVKNEDSSYRLELDGISLIVDGFFIRDEKHWIKNPNKALAFFNIHGHLYGISNGSGKYYTAEDFYDIMCKQYAFFA